MFSILLTRTGLSALAAALCLCLFSQRAAAAPFAVARPFGSHMVLPAGCPLVIHGTATPAATVDLELAGMTFTGRADATGAWRIALPAQHPNKEGMTMVLHCGNETLRLEDLLAGEVWFAAGQSNMDFPLSSSTGGKTAVANANLPALRLFALDGPAIGPRAFTAQERERLVPGRWFTGSWTRSTPSSAAGFSAVAWWAAARRHELTGLPVGIIECAVGGSGTEAWIPLATLAGAAETAPLCTPGWLDHPQLSRWARGRILQNLGAGGGTRHPYQPGFLFDAGVGWWRGFPLAGIWWYQGETNAELDDSEWNLRLLEQLVRGWRGGLDAPDLAFHIIELPRIGGNDPLRQHWPAYRAVQAQACRTLPNTTLVPTTDLGYDSPDVHPPDKLPVARRLADMLPVDAFNRVPRTTR